MSFSLNKTKTTISGSVNFKNYSFDYDESTYKLLRDYEDQIYNAETAEDEKQLLTDVEELIVALIDDNKKNAEIDKRLVFNDGKYYLKAPNGAISLQEIPNSLVELLVSARQEGLDIDPYIKCWTLFLQNPNFTPAKAELFGNYLAAKFVDTDVYAKLIEEGYSEDRAKALSTYNEVSISRSGLLLTYKYVDLVEGSYEDALNAFGDAPTRHAEDFKFLPPVMRTNGDKVLVLGELTHNVRVGAIHELPGWGYVNCNDHQSCVKGLHLGSQTYIRCFGGRTSFLLNCLASPSDIGAIVQGYGEDQGALRMLRYYPVSVNIAPNKGRYHESTLLDKCEADWSELRQKVIDDTNEKIMELNKLKNFVKSI